jgi:hypothetical protein
MIVSIQTIDSMPSVNFSINKTKISDEKETF